MRIPIALILAVALAGCTSTPARRSHPDQHVFAMLTKALDDYREASPYSFTVVVSPHDGLLQTGWYPVHKGEIELKIVAAVDGERYTVESWQRSSWGLLRRPAKTDWSRRTESNIVERVERLMKEERRTQ